MNLKVFVFIVTTVLVTTELTNAQYLSVRGDFEVNQQLGCHDLTVTVTNINPGTGTIIYQEFLDCNVSTHLKEYHIAF